MIRLDAEDPGGLAIAGLVLAASGFALVPLALASLRSIAGERVVAFSPGWGLRHAVAGLLVGVLARVAFGVVVAGEGVVPSLTRSVLVVGAVAVFAAGTAWRLHPEGLGALGLGAGRAVRSTAAGLSAYALCLPMIVGLEILWLHVLRVVGIEEEPDGLVDTIVALEGASTWVAIGITVVVGPIVEEIVFRSFLQPVLTRGFGARGGIAITSGLFALMHPFVFFLPLFALSSLLGAIQHRTHRLSAVWAVHSAHNALVLLVAFRFPEIRELLR